MGAGLWPSARGAVALDRGSDDLVLTQAASSIVVERATAADVQSVAAIEQSAFSDPWSHQSFAELVDNTSAFFGVARVAGDQSVVGYVVAWFVLDEAEIANLAVRPSNWGQRVGGALLDAALQESAIRGVRTVYLEMRDSNSRARRLYQARGFTEFGRRRNYYRRPQEDAVLWRKPLSR